PRDGALTRADRRGPEGRGHRVRDRPRGLAAEPRLRQRGRGATDRPGALAAELLNRALAEPNRGGARLRIAPAVDVDAHLQDLVVVVDHELVAAARPPGTGA